ncbi:MAG: glycosyltransferase family 4 protein [bacterium]|nr:glycosyltransferase family 4 protein [Candidatus Kapabacteria bacterium]
MNIVLVSQGYPPENGHGGVGTQTRTKAHGLARRGHVVTVLAHSVDECRHEYRDGDVNVVRVPSRDSRIELATTEARWLAWSFEAAAALAELHARRPIDIAEFPEFAGEAYFHLVNRATWNHIPTVIQLHGPLAMLARTIEWPEIDSELYRVGCHMESEALRRADAIYSSSKLSIDWCSREYGTDPESIPVMHAGIDVQHFAPNAAAKDEGLTVLFVGRIAESKGVTDLLDACINVRHSIPDLRLRLVGTGEAEYCERLLSIARDANASQMLELAGYVDHENLPRELNRAHVFAAPSRYEGGPGFVYLEAMACGLPVIACAGSGASEAVDDYVDGLLVEPGNIESISRALLTLLQNVELREAMGANARRAVLRSADADSCVGGIEEFYRATLAAMSNERTMVAT